MYPKKQQFKVIKERHNINMQEIVFNLKQILYAKSFLVKHICTVLKLRILNSLNEQVYKMKHKKSRNL